MDDGSASRDHCLDDATIELGRREVARIREQLGPRPAPTTTTSEPEPTSAFSADRMSAEMAAGADRERLETRVAQLETEVGQLRTALAAVLQAAATGIASTAPDGEQADHTDDESSLTDDAVAPSTR